MQRRKTRLCLRAKHHRRCRCLSDQGAPHVSTSTALAALCPIAWYQPPPRSDVFFGGVTTAVLTVGMIVLVRWCVGQSRTTTAPSLQLSGARRTLHDVLLVTVAWAGALVLHRAWTGRADELTVFMGSL